MAVTKANKPKRKKPASKTAKPKHRKEESQVNEPETVAEAKELKQKFKDLATEDQVLLRSPEPEDKFKSSDSWRVFRIMSEFVNGFDELATITRGVSVFG